MVSISAIINCRACILARGLPNCTRFLVWFTARSMASWAMPRHMDDTPTRPTDSVFMALMKPMPTSPMTQSLGTRTSSSTTSLTGTPRWPIFSSWRPQDTPGRFISTMKQVMPLAPFSGAVLA